MCVRARVCLRASVCTRSVTLVLSFCAKLVILIACPFFVCHFLVNTRLVMTDHFPHGCCLDNLYVLTLLNPVKLKIFGVNGVIFVFFGSVPSCLVFNICLLPNGTYNCDLVAVNIKRQTRQKLHNCVSGTRKYLKYTL